MGLGDGHVGLAGATHRKRVSGTENRTAGVMDDAALVDVEIGGDSGARPGLRSGDESSAEGRETRVAVPKPPLTAVEELTAMADLDIARDLDLDALWHKQRSLWAFSRLPEPEHSGKEHAPQAPSPFGVKPEPPPSPDVVSRFAEVAKRFPKLRAFLESSATARSLIAEPRAMRAFLDVATGNNRGKRGIDDLIMTANYEKIAALGADRARLSAELAKISEVRDEIEKHKHGARWTPGCDPLPLEPDQWESEQFVSLQMHEDAADKDTARMYLHAYGPQADVVVPFAALFVAAVLATMHVVWYAWYPCFFFTLFFFNGLARYAEQAPTTTRKGMLSLFGAATVHALMLFCGIQYLFVYVAKEKWATHPFVCVVGCVAFVTTEIAFWRVYLLGPGFLPTANDPKTRDAWAGNMRRVSRAVAKLATKGLKDDDVASRAVAETASLNALSDGGRYCRTCHTARCLRSKHCPFCDRCVSRMDHHCPIAGTCIGVRNQRHFAFALWDMTLGQSIFLWCSYTHLAALPGPWILGGFTKDPWAMTLFLIQCLATPYCLLLALRMTAGIAANLTVNEMENAHRYEYLQEPDEDAALKRAKSAALGETDGGTEGDEKKYPGYMNPFDRGVANNCLEFWRGHQERVDWDAQRAAVVLGEARKPPRGSYAWLHKEGGRAGRVIPAVQRIVKMHVSAADAAERQRRREQGHGHSHDGKPCDGDHGAKTQDGAPTPAGHGHGHSHGGEPCDGNHGDVEQAGDGANDNGVTLMSVRDELAAARASELRARAHARGVSVAVQEAEEARARREETTARAAAMGVSETELLRAEAESTRRDAAAAGLSVEQYEIVRESALRKEREAQRVMEVRRAEFKAMREGQVAGQAAGQAALSSEDERGASAGTGEDSVASEEEAKENPDASRPGPDAWKTHGTRAEVLAEAAEVKREMLAEQAEQAGMSVPEMEAMAENQMKQMVKMQAAQMGVTPEQFEKVNEERKAEAAAANGMDVQEYEARMQLRQIAMYKAQMAHMQRMQQMAAQHGHHGHGHHGHGHGH